MRAASSSANADVGHSVVAAWNRFWFTPADPTLLGAIRICCGIVVLYVHLCYTWDLPGFLYPDGWIDREHFDLIRRELPYRTLPFAWNEERPPLDRPLSEEEKQYAWRWDGIRPHEAYSRGIYSWTIFVDIHDPFWIHFTHWAFLVVAFLFTIGFCTRVTAVLTWLGALSYIQRTIVVLFGMDNICNVALIYLMLAPSGAALSVDRLIGRWWQSYRRLRRRAQADGDDRPSLDDALTIAPPRPRISANVALRALQIQLCIIYGMSGLSKLQGASWWNGQAVWGTFANQEFAPLHNPIFYYTLKFLCEHRVLWELTMTFGSWATLAFEIGFPFLVWQPRLRWTMVVCAVLLHLGIAVFMSLTGFAMIMLTYVLGFVPQEALHRTFRRLGRGAPHATLAFAGSHLATLRTVSLIRALDVFDQIRFVEAKPGDLPDGTIEFRDAARSVRGPTLWVRLLGHLRLFWLPFVALAVLTQLFAHGLAGTTDPAWADEQPDTPNAREPADAARSTYGE